MKFEETLTKVIDEIADLLKYSVSNEPIELDPIYTIEQQRMDAILRKLESEEKIKVLRYANDDAWRQTMDPYINPVNYLLEIVDSSFFSGSDKDRANLRHTEGVVNIEDIERINYHIIYTEDRRVMLNGLIELARTNFNGENDLIFSFLYKNPNKTYSREDLENACKTKFTKAFNKVVENLGFYRGLKKAFFDVSKNSIRFNNPGKISKTS